MFLILYVTYLIFVTPCFTIDGLEEHGVKYANQCEGIII